MFIQNEHDEIMNELVRDVRSVLGERGVTLRIVVSADLGTDLVVCLDAGERGDKTYVVQLRSRLTSENARALPPADRSMLVIAPYISRAAAEVLQRNGVDFVDQVGNMSIDWPSMHITVLGNAAAHVRRPTSHHAPRAFSPSGTQVLFTLLSWTDTVTLPLRAIAERSGVSLGTAQIVMNELEVGGYLYTVGTRRTLANGRELLDRWTEAFTTSLAHKLAIAEFRDDSPRWWMDTRELLAENKIQLGGEAAGSILDSDLSPVTATLYGDFLPSPVIATRRWRRTESEPNVLIRRRFWMAPEPFELLVPSTLIYADMWASGDPRQRNHAERIRSHDHRLVELDRS
ncbi:MAG: hypothetical protein JWN03_8961 [Nocardia sp.]|uniref:type IV toxin-antitoxin system AbiEi family antitoxin n=1 Tax=Nocardia sp. TaxID=1821 RepID=UPI002635CCF8|nr:type IV toxin-antitoxin system AbiEi family antitoxin [Nocardia sp.]MCU1648686.1 hypothetical protein [Nocardia sp.]